MPKYGYCVMEWNDTAQSIQHQSTHTKPLVATSIHSLHLCAYPPYLLTYSLWAVAKQPSDGTFPPPRSSPPCLYYASTPNPLVPPRLLWIQKLRAESGLACRRGRCGQLHKRFIGLRARLIQGGKLAIHFNSFWPSSSWCRLLPLGGSHQTYQSPFGRLEKVS